MCRDLGVATLGIVDNARMFVAKNANKYGKLYKPICVAPLQSIFDQLFDHAWGYSARGLHTFSPGRGSA